MSFAWGIELVFDPKPCCAYLALLWVKNTEQRMTICGFAMKAKCKKINQPELELMITKTTDEP